MVSECVPLMGELSCRVADGSWRPCAPGGDVALAAVAPAGEAASGADEAAEVSEGAPAPEEGGGGKKGALVGVLVTLFLLVFIVGAATAYYYYKAKKKVFVERTMSSNLPFYALDALAPSTPQDSGVFTPPQSGGDFGSANRNPPSATSYPTPP